MTKDERKREILKKQISVLGVVEGSPSGWSFAHLIDYGNANSKAQRQMRRAQNGCEDEILCFVYHLWKQKPVTSALCTLLVLDFSLILSSFMMQGMNTEPNKG